MEPDKVWMWTRGPTVTSSCSSPSPHPSSQFNMITGTTHRSTCEVWPRHESRRSTVYWVCHDPCSQKDWLSDWWWCPPVTRQPECSPVSRHYSQGLASCTVATSMDCSAFNYKWRLNPVWHKMLYSCTHMATLGVKGLNCHDLFVITNHFDNLSMVSISLRRTLTTLVATLQGVDRQTCRSLRVNGSSKMYAASAPLASAPSVAR